MAELISRKALLEEFDYWYKCLGGTTNQRNWIIQDAISSAIDTINEAPAIDAEPVRNGDGCEFCRIRETGTGMPMLLGNDWMVCIKKSGSWYSLVMNHAGDQEELPIGSCPDCGAKLDGGADNG